jgi:hypothetical protein
MEIKTKFNIGDWVYVVDSLKVSNPVRHVDCDACDSTGVIEIRGCKYYCPKCKGVIKYDTNIVRKRYSIITESPMTIDSVEVKINKEKEEIKYKLNKTGLTVIGLVNESQCFATLEDAEYFVNSENKKFERAEIKKYGCVLPEFKEVRIL